jgi:hypothetical protein
MMNTRTFALIFGIVFLIVGAGGFVPGLTDHSAVPHSDLSMTQGFGHELGMFPINLLHNIVHLLFGIWGLIAYRSYAGARSYARAVAIIYGVLTVMGLIPTLNTTFGFIPIYGADVFLHALLAIVAAYFGWMHRDAAGDRA